MSLTTPTTKDVSDNIIAQLESALSQTIPLLPQSFLLVLAKVLSGVFILLYKYGGSIFLNLFVATASDKDTTILGTIVNPLTFWGRLIGVGDPVAATNAELIIDITVENQVGSLPSGSQLINATNGVTYITLGTILLDAAIKQASVRAVSDQAGGGGAGTIGNIDIGAVLSFANPLANVARNTTVSGVTTTAANADTTDTYIRAVQQFQIKALFFAIIGLIHPLHPDMAYPGKVAAEMKLVQTNR